MIRAAICDDEREITDQLSRHLKGMQKDTKEGLEVRCFYSGEEIKCEIEKGWQYHILFLDIELGKENGIALAGRIRDRYPATIIIFITGYEQYVYESFQVQPLDFLRKPLEREAVEKALLRAIKLCDSAPVWEFAVKKCLYRVPLADICYFASDKRKIVVCTGREEQTYYGKLDEAEEKLIRHSVNFVRISKSVMINMRYVRKMDYQEVVLESGGNSWKFAISRAYQAKVREYCLDRWQK